jgi:hypothetical protein
MENFYGLMEKFIAGHGRKENNQVMVYLNLRREKNATVMKRKSKKVHLLYTVV